MQAVVLCWPNQVPQHFGCKISTLLAQQSYSCLTCRSLHNNCTAHTLESHSASDLPPGGSEYNGKDHDRPVRKLRTRCGLLKCASSQTLKNILSHPSCRNRECKAAVQPEAWKHVAQKAAAITRNYG